MREARCGNRQTANRFYIYIYTVLLLVFNFFKPSRYYSIPSRYYSIIPLRHSGPLCHLRTATSYGRTLRCFARARSSSDCSASLPSKALCWSGHTRTPRFKRLNGCALCQRVGCLRDVRALRSQAVAATLCAFFELSCAVQCGLSNAKLSSAQHSFTLELGLKQIVHGGVQVIRVGGRGMNLTHTNTCK